LCRKTKGWSVTIGRAQGGEIAVTVYVHKDRGQTVIGSLDPWFSLTADTDDELHAFAARLGLLRNSFHPGAPTGKQASVSGHYDLSKGERDQALALGAQPSKLRA
jgi:hypothetical protein